MAIIDGEEPLILSPHEAHHLEEKKKKKGLILKWVKWFLEMTIFLVSISWLILVFLFSMQWFNMSYKSWMEGFGVADKVFLVFGSPVLIVSLLAMAHQVMSDWQGGEEEERLRLEKRSSEKASYRLSTFPVMVDHKVFGVVSAAEALGIVIVMVYLIWSLIQFTITNIQELADAEENKMYLLFYGYGIGIGDIGSFAMTLLFVPVTRGSSLLRLINVPFEHAIKYHIWLGNFTVLTFILHGLSMALAYTSKGDFKAIFSWESTAAANLAGVIALSIIVLMFVSSFHCVRRKYFESFYYMHQLYVLFLIFFAFHVGDFFFVVPAGAIFVYMVDRFLRFCQSRVPVDVVSCKYLSCGVVELALAKPPNLRYNALSYIFVRIREVSSLQWHPFSLSSTRRDGKDHLSVMIKARGQWTSKLLSMLKTMGDESQQHSLTAFVEGPYGHQLPYYLMYKDLVLVAGGIGISPFLAIVNDILARVESDEPCLATNILLIWAVKNSNELQLLSNLSSSTSHKLVDLDTRVYVTQEPRPPTASSNRRNQPPVEVITRTTTSLSRRHTISNLVGMGSATWLAMYFTSCVTGLVIFKASWDILLKKSIVSDSMWWVNGIVLLAGMAGVVVAFGGIVLGFWRFREAKIAVLGQIDRDQEENYLIREDITGFSVEYGSRPDMEDIFGGVNETRGHVDVGVIVCGPSGLKSSAAAQCRRLNLGRNCDQPIFHFHSHSFSL